MTILDAHRRERPGSEADVCVLGAGAAGITLALELEVRGARCVVLEGGGLDHTDASQALYGGTNVGAPYLGLAESRLRFFGGSTNHWGGWCRPLDPPDLAARTGHELSGWPIDHAELARYYPRAEELCELGVPGWDAATWFSRVGSRPLATDPSRFATEVFRFSPPTRFGERYHADLERSGSVTVVLNANAVGLVGGERGIVRGVAVRTLDGDEFEVRARRVVVAMGGIENARFLLHTNDGGRGPFGDRGGFLGCCFMEHLMHLWGADLLTSPAVVEELAGYLPYHRIDPGTFFGVMVASPELRAEHDLGAYSATFADVTEMLGDRFDPLMTRGVQSLMRLRHRATADRLISLYVRAEQVPNVHSRVRLGTGTDALGMRRPVLEWRLVQEDFRTIARGTELLATELARLDLGRVHQTYDARAGWSGLAGGSHHMGTTRMHHSPSLGVVDADGRVHGTANLYVAGSSVFPTSGFANPTLTVVALAARLAHHLAEAS